MGLDLGSHTLLLRPARHNKGSIKIWHLVATYRMGLTLPSRALFRTCHNRAIPFLIVPYQTSPRPYPSGWTFSAATVTISAFTVSICRIKVIWLLIIAKHRTPLARLGHLNYPKRVSSVECGVRHRPRHLSAPDGIGSGLDLLLRRHFRKIIDIFRSRLFA